MANIFHYKNQHGGRTPIRRSATSRWSVRSTHHPSRTSPTRSRGRSVTATQPSNNTTATVPFPARTIFDPVAARSSPHAVRCRRGRLLLSTANLDRSCNRSGPPTTSAPLLACTAMCPPTAADTRMRNDTLTSSYLFEQSLLFSLND